MGLFQTVGAVSRLGWAWNSAHVKSPNLSHKTPPRHAFPVFFLYFYFLSWDKWCSLLFLCQLIADSQMLFTVPSLDTYSSIALLYCTSEDRMCNIPTLRNESAEISLCLVQIILFGQRKRNPLLSLDATGGFSDEAVFISICGLYLWRPCATLRFTLKIWGEWLSSSS